MNRRFLVGNVTFDLSHEVLFYSPCSQFTRVNNPAVLLHLNNDYPGYRYDVVVYILQIIEFFTLVFKSFSWRSFFLHEFPNQEI